jgi:hypothetical protein
MKIFAFRACVSQHLTKLSKIIASSVWWNETVLLDDFQFKVDGRKFGDKLEVFIKKLFRASIFGN